MELSGKVCLVTGGNSGIGAATALSLARRGAKIVTASRRGADQKPENLSAIEGDGTICFLKADFGDPTACRNCVDEVVKQFGRLDVVVHSAGGAVPGGRREVRAIPCDLAEPERQGRAQAPRAPALRPGPGDPGPGRGRAGRLDGAARRGLDHAQKQQRALCHSSRVHWLANLPTRISASTVSLPESYVRLFRLPSRQNRPKITSRIGFHYTEKAGPRRLRS